MTSATVRVAYRHKKLPILLLFVFLLAGVPDILARAWPTSIWYELDEVIVSDAESFDKLTITARRTIFRPFVGSYRVTVWPVNMVRPICTGGNTIDYQRAFSKEIRVTGDWWIANQSPDCDKEMQVGYYRMLTCIEVNPRSPLLFWLPPPTACTWSNIFRIFKGERP